MQHQFTTINNKMLAKTKKKILGNNNGQFNCHRFKKKLD